MGILPWLSCCSSVLQCMSKMKLIRVEKSFPGTHWWPQKTYTVHACARPNGLVVISDLGFSRQLRVKHLHLLDVLLGNFIPSKLTVQDGSRWFKVDGSEAHIGIPGIPEWKLAELFVAWLLEKRRASRHPEWKRHACRRLSWWARQSMSKHSNTSIWIYWIYECELLHSNGNGKTWKNYKHWDSSFPKAWRRQRFQGDLTWCKVGTSYATDWVTFPRSPLTNRNCCSKPNCMKTSGTYKFPIQVMFKVGNEKNPHHSLIHKGNCPAFSTYR